MIARRSIGTAIVAASLLLAAATGPSAQAPAPRPGAIAHAGTTSLADGRLLLSGGVTDTGIMDTVHVVGAAGGAMYPLPSARADHRATLLPAGRVALSGGQGASGIVDTVEIVDPISGVTASATVRLARAVTQHAAALVPDGRLLVIGGRGAGGHPFGTVQALDLDHAHAAELIDLAEARAGHTATVLTTGDVLIAGGEGGSGILDTAEVWSGTGATGASIMLSDRLSEPRAGHTATLLPSGDVVIAGGLARGGMPSAGLERFDAGRQTFHRQSGKLATARAYHSATLLGDGRVLFWGGVDAAGRVLADGELYDPSTQAVQPVTDLTAALAGGAISPALAESRPAVGATGVAVAVRIALRFNQPLAVTSVTAASVRLASAGGTVGIAQVPVEAGLLLFVTPGAPLAPGTRYTLTLDGLRSTTGEALPVTTVAFTTAGAREQAGGSGARDVTDPDEHDAALGRDARTGRRTSPWHELPPLEAPRGVTAIAGQVLQLNGRPLGGVTLEIDGQRTRSDTTGRFLLRDLPEAGAKVLVIDGRTANRTGAAYGEFEVSVDVAQGRTTVLGYTVWMPKIDWAHAVPIPSPTTQETVISTPALPGFEVRIPPGTVVYDREGNVVRQISITPIPNDRPPFPMPDGVSFPTYFTVQPGGAILQTDSTVAPAGARVVYPNTGGHAPGVEADFWNYEPQGGVGWYRYGVGRVNDGGTDFEPGEGMRVHKFTMFTLVPPNLHPLVPSWWANLWAGAFGGDPVDLSTGLFVLNKTDLAIADVLPLALTRTYRPGDTVSRSFGIGTNHNYGLVLYSENGFITLSLVLAGGERVRYQRTSSGTGYTNAVLEHTEAPSPFYKSVLRYDPGFWTLTLRDGTVYRFTYNGDLMSITDRFANAITLTRESLTVPGSKIQRITGPSGRWIDLTYDSQSRIVQATDHQGRAVGYVYDASGRLWKVIDAAGGVTEYTYDASHRLLTIKDARGIVFLTNEYDTNGRVTKQTQADATTYQFAYTLDGAGKITQTNLTNPRGYVRRLTFSAAGYPLTDTHAHAQAQAQTVTYTRQAATNFILTATDALSRQTALTYDAQGNVASVTRLAGTAEAVATSFVHETPGTGTFNRLTSLTTPIATTTLAYNDTNRTITITDPLSHATVITHNTRGQVATIANALSHTTTFSYDAQNNLTGITDPLSTQTTRAFDGYGRLIRQTDPRGNVTVFNYDALNQLTTIADAQQGTTRFAYDANGNLLSVTDARGNATSYTYSSMDRPATRTDALTRQETYSYDNNGNPTTVTDRKSQATTLAYDPLDRLTSRTYADSSTIAYTYDAGNRLTQVVDSVAGAITPSYDNLDRLLSEATPNGTVEYTYDALGRRLTMDVPGQAQISYAWDDANRLTTITQGSNVVTFDYDTANRRTKLTYPSGTSTEYAYDTASRLTGLTYKHGGNTLGALTYTYDVTSQRTQVGGSWARTDRPNALASATYNAGNQQTAFGSQTLTYDLNGNLTGDGTNSYTWNARDQLASLTGPLAGSFVYDAFGRRQRKTIDGTITDFVYDGLNPVRQAVGASTVDLLTGLGIDEYLTRTDSSGPRDLLADALGSTVSVSDSSGTIQTEYNYEPFGTATTSGAGSSNEFAYTGRESDGTGVYYYRARYYHPGLQRFVSEDPLEFGAGDTNLYTYVFNQPTGFRDPSGLEPITISTTAAVAIVCAAGAIAGDAVVLAVNGRKTTAAQLAAGAAIGCVGGVGILAGYAAAAGAASVGAAELAFSGASRGLRAAETWGNPKSLLRHFRDHGGDFAAKNADDYAAQASRFLQRSQAQRLPTKIDAQGVIRVYDHKTNTFGAYNPNGTTRTFFRPDRGGAYWNDQPGVAP